MDEVKLGIYRRIKSWNDDGLIYYNDLGNYIHYNTQNKLYIPVNAIIEFFGILPQGPIKIKYNNKIYVISNVTFPSVYWKYIGPSSDFEEEEIL